MKPSEMIKGKRYRVVLEGPALYILDDEAALGEYGTSNILMDKAPHIISIEEIATEYPVGTVAIHRSGSGMLVFRLFRGGWYDMRGAMVSWKDVYTNSLEHSAPVEFVTPEMAKGN